MFSGIIEDVGVIDKITNQSTSKIFEISCSNILNDSKIGDSISCNGVCLTITSISNDKFSVDVVDETLSCTTLNSFKEGTKINLERAMRYTDRVGGHLVQGHVDGLGVVNEINNTSEWTEIELLIDKDFKKYCIHKGSVSIDGVSLTIAKLDDNGIRIALIPHTLENTILSDYNIGSNVNIEFDMISKYVENFIEKE